MKIGPKQIETLKSHESPELFGTVPDGWSRGGWMMHLRQQIERARLGDHARARRLTQWLELLKAENG